jgi:hypothetical protein
MFHQSGQLDRQWTEASAGGGGCGERDDRAVIAFAIGCGRKFRDAFCTEMPSGDCGSA